MTVNLNLVARSAASSTGGEVLRALADPTRLEILRRLAFEELCACHLVADLGLSQPLVSHHLKVLAGAGLITSRRQSYWTYHRLRPEPLLEMASELASLAQAASAPSTPRACC